MVRRFNGGLIIAATEENKELNTLSLDWLVSNLRWLWLFLTAMFVFLQYTLSAEIPVNSSRLLILILVGVILNSIYAGLLWARFFPGWLAMFTAILDATLAVGLLILLNDQVQLLLPLMLFPVLIAGIRWNAEVGLLVALPIVFGYGVMSLVPLLQGDINRADLIAALLKLGANAITLFAAGTLPSAFVRRRVALAEQAVETELNELRIENERGKLISEMAVTLSSTINYRKVLRAMIDLAFSALAEVGTRDESTIGMVLLFEGTRGELKVAAGRNIGRADEGRWVSAEEGLIGRTIHTAEVTITNHVQKDKTLTSFASLPGCRSAICAPLRAGFSTYGAVLFCSTEPNFYNIEHKKLLTTFCSQAIIALQNAQLFDDLRHEQQKILEKEAEARRKLARDLHDGPTQSIAAIAMRLNFLKMVVKNKDMEKAYDELVKVEDIAQRTTQEIRTMLFTMRPVILETQGLVPALTQYVERLNANEAFKVDLSNHGYEGQLSQEAESVVFAIIEEAVNNAKKHAQATLIIISLTVKRDNLHVDIKDNGLVLMCRLPSPATISAPAWG